MANGELDETDRKLLRALSADSRITAAALAPLVGLTRQAVAERMERLRNEHVILRYTAAVDPDKQGLTVRAFIAITLLPVCSEKQESSVLTLLRCSPWVQECYRVTGDDYFQARVVAPQIEDVRDLVLALRRTGFVQSTRTMLALETLFEKSAVGYLEVAEENPL
jgi:Lrp/AsnC family leucine-responsive transcriptional regulator